MKNVLIVCGGKSYEHDISVVTAAQIYSRTRLNDVNLKILYISRDNHFFIYSDQKVDIKDFSKARFNSASKNFKEVFFVSSEKGKIFVRSMFGLKEFMCVTTAIVCCHGNAGEDGRVVSFLENMGIKCSSGNFDSLAICMNKFLFKQCMKGDNIPVVRGFLITKQTFDEDKELILLKLRLMKYPVVLKPNSGGSSIGLFVANSEEEFLKNLQSAFEFEDDVIVEKFVSGAREFNVAIIGNKYSYEISDVDEPIKNNEVLTFADKYLSGNGAKKVSKMENGSMASSARKLHADIDEKLTDLIKKTAEKVFVDLSLVGVVRIDFLYDEANEKLYVCEVNAVPGSLSYYFFNHGKFLLNDFVLKLIDLAETKQNKDDKINSDFVTSVL